MIPKLITSMRTYDRAQEIGMENVFGNLDDALNRARRLVGVAEEPPPAGALPTVERERVGDA